MISSSRLLIAVGLVVAVGALAPTAATAKPPTRAQVAKLKHQIRALKDSRAEWRERARYAESDLTDIQDELESATTEVKHVNTLYNTEMPKLIAQRDAANAEVEQVRRGQLGASITEIARHGSTAELWDLVIAPAYSGWVCGGSRYFGETFVSFDFDRRASDGECY